MTQADEEQRINWNRVLLNKARALHIDVANRDRVEPMPRVTAEWRAWNERRLHHEAVMEAIDDAEVSMERDPSFFVGPQSAAEVRSSQGFDPQTGMTWQRDPNASPETFDELPLYKKVFFFTVVGIVALLIMSFLFMVGGSDAPTYRGR